ncbi:hypothetical protein V6O07_11985, partial [Arthrospira platensis SPKY2]
MFLARDGLRNLAATERIDDVELSAVSDPVRPHLEGLLRDMDSYVIDSVVFKGCSQYRLYYYPKGAPTRVVRMGQAFIATLFRTQQGFDFAWSEYKGDAICNHVEGRHKGGNLQLCSLVGDSK